MSSNIYRNSAVASSSTSAFEKGYKAYNSSTSGVSSGDIRTKKFVTKKSGNDKYKILLKLGQTYEASSLITNMQGDPVNSTIVSSKYSDLDGTASTAPIEQYAISTWYGEWPSEYVVNNAPTGYSYEYRPVVPYGTTFPSGQIMNPDYTTDSIVSVARNYFGYNSNFIDWLINHI